ncbi:MAG: hypothetical protein KC933_32585 [Myxococcales bacterium]|nr:hypothetical protein [Myxococcales bacterium]
MSEVVEQYQANFNRRPTVGEWEALLRTVLSAPDDEFRMFDDGVAKSVRIELESVEDYWRRVTAP